MPNPLPLSLSRANRRADSGGTCQLFGRTLLSRSREAQTVREQKIWDFLFNFYFQHLASLKLVLCIVTCFHFAGCNADLYVASHLLCNSSSRAERSSSALLLLQSDFTSACSLSPKIGSGSFNPSDRRGGVRGLPWRGDDRTEKRTPLMLVASDSSSSSSSSGTDSRAESAARSRAASILQSLSSCWVCACADQTSVKRDPL